MTSRMKAIRTVFSAAGFVTIAPRLRSQAKFGSACSRRGTGTCLRSGTVRNPCLTSSERRFGYGGRDEAHRRYNAACGDRERHQAGDAGSHVLRAWPPGRKCCLLPPHYRTQARRSPLLVLPGHGLPGGRTTRRGSGRVRRGSRDRTGLPAALARHGRRLHARQPQPRYRVLPGGPRP